MYANSRDVGYGANFHSYVTYFHAKGSAVEIGNTFCEQYSSPLSFTQVFSN